MKITLVQSEIEAAIQSYIGGQMTIAKGMAISIELKATRGDEGYMAFIDIRPGQQTQIEQPAQLSPVELRPTVASIPRARLVQTSQEVPEQEETGEGQTVAGETEDGQEAPFIEGQTVATHAPAAPAAAAPAAALAEAAPAVAEKPAGTRGRSLFGGLQKPKN